MDVYLEVCAAEALGLHVSAVRSARNLHVPDELHTTVSGMVAYSRKGIEILISGIIDAKKTREDAQEGPEASTHGEIWALIEKTAELSAAKLGAKKKGREQITGRIMRKPVNKRILIVKMDDGHVVNVRVRDSARFRLREKIPIVPGQDGAWDYAGRAPRAGRRPW